MNAELQSRCWACLPKEARDEIRYEYRKTLYQQVKDILRYFFGHHNLTSDEEPSELLFVERDKIINICKDALINIEQSVLYELFGDKCLPDKDIPNAGSGEISTTPPAHKLDVKPKHVSTEEICKILGIENDGSLVRKPYKEPSVQVEPKFHKGDKVKIIVSDDGVVTTIKSYDTINGQFVYWLEGSLGYYLESQLEPYTEPETKDNMEEKELNLVELLRGCEEETFYSPITGFELELKEAVDNYVLFKRTDFQCSADGRMYSRGQIVLWPSFDLYEKYPLDAAQAWQTWAEERKPKYEVKSIIEYGEVGNKSSKWAVPYNIIVSSKEEAQQAAEAVRECLAKFQKAEK